MTNTEKRIETAAKQPHNFEIDDRVEAGTPGTDDHDTGRIVAVDGDEITVAWDSHVTTTQHASLLRPEHTAS